MPRRRFVLPWRSRATIAREVDAELAFHLEMRVEELTRAGLSREVAERRALDEFGDVELTREYCRTMDERSDRNVRLAEQLGDWRQDFRTALRGLRRNLGFTTVAMLTLTLAIGANTAVFSVVSSVLVAPLPYGDGSRLVEVYNGDVKDPTTRWPLSPADFIDFSAQQHSLTGLLGMMPGSATWVPRSGDPEILAASYVTPNAFDLLGVRAAYGRTFLAGDEKDENGRRVVLNNRFWRRAFGADPRVIGTHLSLGGESYEVVGIAPPGFSLGTNEDVYYALDFRDAMSDAVRARKQHYVRAIGRLKPGVTLAAARADLATIEQRLAAQYPESNTDRTANAMPLREWMAGNVGPALLLLQGAALVVLLIACANLANLTLSRAIGRRRELAVRAALGAGRGRLVRLLLTESFVLATVGAAAGAALARIATHVLLGLNATAVPSLFSVKVDTTALLFTLGIAVASGILFGIAPAFAVLRYDIQSSLKEGGRGSSSGRGGERIRRVLVVAQVGLAVVLLVGGGLLVRSFSALLHAPLGFSPDHVLTAQVRAAGSRYDTAAPVNRFYDDVIDGLKNAPGVNAVGAVTMLPTQGNVSTSLRVEGTVIDESHLPDLGYLAIRGDYLKAMHVALLAGRSFDATDRADGPPVALVNETAARRYFPKGNAVGARVRIGPDPSGNPITIVGVIADIRDLGLGVPSRPTIIMDHVQQAWDRSLSIVIRNSGDPTVAIDAVRRAVRAADPTLAVRNIATLEQVVGESLAARRFALGLVGSFAALSLLLAAIGIYGVLSYAVATRTREFGVRIALGATSRSVLVLVARQGLAWTITGLVAGLAIAVASGRLLAGIVYGVSVLDGWTYAGVALTLLVVAGIACLIPAARATRVDPLTSMRAD